MEQYSSEWWQARLGKVTASRVIDIIRGRNGYKAARQNYLAEKVCEILTGQPQESFTSTAMEWGTQTEPLARQAYEAHKGCWVEEVGLICSEEIPRLGGSADGLIDDDGGLEIKCPNTATHLDTFLNGTIKQGYIYQMQTGLYCTGREWWDFVSFDPRLPAPYDFKCIRVERDETIIEQIKQETLLFLTELDEMIEKLRSMA